MISSDWYGESDCAFVELARVYVRIFCGSEKQCSEESRCVTCAAM